MATEIVRWCDRHMAQDERVAGELVTVALGGRPAKGLDLCPACRDEVIKPLEALLDEFGAAMPTPAATAPGRPRKAVPAAALPTLPGAELEPPAAAGKAHPCLFCPATLTTGEGAYGHMARKHGTPRKAPDLLGPVCPVCGVDTGGGSAGIHIAQAHRDYGFPSALAAFAWARDNGDPHGVYAATVAKGHA